MERAAQAAADDLVRVHRIREVCWLPRTDADWLAFTQMRVEAARLWNDLVLRHRRLRRLNWSWPSLGRWQRWAKGRYPGLSAQSVQQGVRAFCDAVNATRQLRKRGHAEARYPWRLERYRDVVFTNQTATVRDGVLRLPAGTSGILHITLPTSIALPGRLMEVRLCMGRVLLVCMREEAPRAVPTQVVGVDLGVNTLLAATDGQQALLVSGREAKATVQWRNKRLASLAQRQSRHTKGSRRWRALQRRKAKVREKARQRIKDLTHKATRQVARLFPDATCHVGKPFNDAARRVGRVQAQQVSQAANRRIITQLAYKTGAVTEVDEHYSSQTCPMCGERSKQRRVYRCRTCGIVTPRDVVGALNILSVGRTGAIQPGVHPPTVVQFRYATDVSWKHPGSSGGHPASSSPRREAFSLPGTKITRHKRWWKEDRLPREGTGHAQGTRGGNVPRDGGVPRGAVEGARPTSGSAMPRDHVVPLVPGFAHARTAALGERHLLPVKQGS